MKRAENCRQKNSLRKNLDSAVTAVAIMMPAQLLHHGMVRPNYFLKKIGQYWLLFFGMVRLMCF